MKKSIIVMLSVALVSAMAIPTFAANAKMPALISKAPTASVTEISENKFESYIIQINEKKTDINACIMVPVRAIAEELGFKVSWNKDSISIDNGARHVNIIIGVDSYILTPSIEGIIGTSAPFSFGTPSVVTNGVTYVPLGLFDALLDNKKDTIELKGNIIQIQTTEKGEQIPDPFIDANVQIPNPFVDCSTMDSARKIAGFSIKIPEKMPVGYLQSLIQASENDMIKIFFENSEKTIEIRKAKGSEDISGVYTVFEEKNTVDVGSIKVSTKGRDGKINVATWNDGEYAYSITVNIDEAGLDRSVISDMVGNIR